MLRLSRKWSVVLSLSLLSVALGFASLHHMAHIARTCYASGDEPTTSGVMQICGLAASGLATFLASLIAAVHKWPDSVPPSGPMKKLLVSVVDTTRLSEAKRIVDNARNDQERQLALQLFDLTVLDLRAEWFPNDTQTPTS